MDELLLPQRLLVQKNNQSLNNSSSNKKIPTSSVKKLRNQVQSTKIKHLSLLEKAEFGQKYIQNYSDEKLHNSASSSSIPITLIDLITERKFRIEEYLTSIDIITLGMTNKILYSFLKLLQYEVIIKFHHVANIIRCGGQFGIFEGCTITIGDGDEIVNADDLQLICSALESPRTQISCVFVAFAIQLNSSITEGMILDFIRSLRYPSLIPLRSLNLEGSLIGESGVMALGNILKKNCLPNLVTLNLNRNRGRYRGIHCLQQCLLASPIPSPLLENLSLSDNFGEISVLEFLCSDVLRTRPRLICLDISQNSLSLSDIEAINLLQRKKSLNLYMLQSLDLSFNPLSDESFHSFLQMIWPLSSPSSPVRQFSRQYSLDSPQRQKSSLKMKQRIHLQTLSINHSQIGNKCFTYLGCLLNEGRFSQLRSLSLGMNNATGQDGIEMILTALLPYQIEKNNSQECRENESNEDLEEFENNSDEKTTNREDLPKHEETEDDWRKGFTKLSIPMNPLSNDGLLAIMTAGTAGAFRYLEELDISDLGASPETIVLFLRNFITHGNYETLKKLVIFGRQPYAGKNVRGYCTPEFLQRVKVS